MGNIWATIKEKLFKIKPSRAVILGLDASGKTTFLINMSKNFNEQHNSIPTIGFNVENLKAGNLTLETWDISGQIQMNPRARGLVKHYYEGLTCLIYMIDASQLENRKESNNNLFHFLVSMEELPDVPILILANKQDIEGACGAQEVEESLNLTQIGKHRRDKLKVFPISGKTGQGVYVAFEWLAKQINKIH